ncbi:hypothetical protein N7456_012732 [Penicillium angulare]|uniref:EKC/KEOPS complex subunit BUD32 n=1 Tax=Penicillium angulare TaxID=116970 RepID=A0A9W9EKB7_9EURO|nr:hypothetical protein N7456_012732 [Penicillium angulare]
MARDEMCLSVAARHLLDPHSKLAKKYPDLHRCLQLRLEHAYASRNRTTISRCDHHVFNGFELGRTDGAIFQEEENSARIDFLNPIFNDTVSSRVNNICELVGNHVEIYGLLGSGTFGAVYLARDRQSVSSGPNWPEVRHYAVKVERHVTLTGGKHVLPISMAGIYDNAQSVRFIPIEALYLLFLSHSARFPKLDSVYVHDRFQSIIMSACVDPALDRRTIQSGDYASKFPAFSGRYLMSPNRIPLLDEMAVCKIASQLLEGIVDMAQINLFHCDLSVNNFLVDPQLNVQLIDLGNVFFGLEDQDFFNRKYAYIPFQEYQMSPELLEVVLRPENNDRDWRNRSWLTLRNDVRRTLLWKFGVIIYGLLHGL